MNKEVLNKVFINYPIDNVLLIEEENYCLFVISGMSESMPIEKWNHLENILTMLTKKEINFIAENQANLYFDNDYKSKGVVVK